jgi:hypothetical protein
MGVHEDIFKKKGEKERSVTRLTSVVFPMRWDADYLINKNRKWVTKKIERNRKSGKVEMRHWVNPNC